jgi:hypothetical protein
MCLNFALLSSGTGNGQIVFNSSQPLRNERRSRRAMNDLMPFARMRADEQAVG